MTENPEKKSGFDLRTQVHELSLRLQPLFDKINILTPIQRLAVVLLSVALLCGGFYYFFYLPKTKDLESLKSQIQRANDSINKSRRELAQLKGLQEKKEKLDLEFKEAMRALPESREIPLLLASISASGSKAGLDFLLFKPESEILRDFYAEIPVSVEMLGGFHETISFLDMLAAMHRVVNIKDIDIQTQKGKGDDNAMIRTRCQIVTYRFLESKPAQQAAKRKGSK